MTTNVTIQPVDINSAAVSRYAISPVLNRFNLSEELLAVYEAQSDDALNSLATASYSVPTISADFTAAVSPSLGERPTAVHPGSYEAIIQSVTFPDLEELQGLLNLVDVTVEQVTLPPLEAIAPSVVIPSAPTDALPTISDNVPLIADQELPEDPGAELPPVPVLDTVVIPTPPTVDAFTFEADFPTDTLTPPEPMFVFNEATYSSNVADALRTKLYTDIVNGGTGLDADVEQAIYDRASDRLEYELSDNYNAELNNWETWGMEMPDGVLSANLREVLAEGTRRQAELSKDVLITQANLAQQNTQFAITSGLVHEQQLMAYANQIAQRAFEVARTTYQAVIDVYRIKLDTFTAKLDGYRAQAAVFESRIRGELAKVEVYRTQMEGARLAGDLNVQQVEIYTRRVQAVQTLIDLYKARMEGVRLKVSVDQARIEGFRALLEAKRTQIDAVTAKYNLYQAQIAGEEAKVNIYSKQVDAYGVQVSAKKTEADINLAEAQAQIEANKDKVALLEAAIRKYQADTDYQTRAEDANVRGYTAETGMYSAEVDRERGYLANLVDEFRSRVAQATSQAEILIREADANLRATLAVKEIQIEALKSAGNISAQKVASALASVSANASLGYSESVSSAYQGSESRSYSGSESRQEAYQHNISE